MSTRKALSLAKRGHDRRSERQRSLKESSDNSISFLSDQKKKELEAVRKIRKAQRMSNIAQGALAAAGAVTGFARGGEDGATIGAGIGSIAGQAITQGGMNKAREATAKLTQRTGGRLDGQIDTLGESRFADTINYANTAGSMARGVKDSQVRKSLERMKEEGYNIQDIDLDDVSFLDDEDFTKEKGSFRYKLDEEKAFNALRKEAKMLDSTTGTYGTITGLDENEFRLLTQ